MSASLATLQTFRDKITSPQPVKKEIKIDLHMNPVFEIGDVIAIQLQTKGKIFNPRVYGKLSVEDFAKADGKYAAFRKIYDSVSYRSKLEPKVQDIRPYFQLYDKVVLA